VSKGTLPVLLSITLSLRWTPNVRQEVRDVLSGGRAGSMGSARSGTEDEYTMRVG